MTEEEQVLHQFLCPHCGTEAEMRCDASRKIRLPQKCIFCGREMLYVPGGRMWDVKYHLEELRKALQPVEEPKEEEKEGGEE